MLNIAIPFGRALDGKPVETGVREMANYPECHVSFNSGVQDLQPENGL
jgi:hypothetical protein